MLSKRVELFECGKCKSLHNNEKDAVMCCVCHICKEADGYYGKLFTATCKSCHEKRNYERFKDKLEKAIEADPTDKGLFPNGSMLFDDNGEFFQDEDDYIDNCDSDQNPVQKQLFIAKYVGFNPEFRHILDDLIEQYQGEDVEIEFNGVEEFKKAFDDFVKKNNHICYFVQDFKYKKTINQPTSEEESK
jgi:hypothetical protein